MTEDHFPPSSERSQRMSIPDEPGWDERYCGKCEQHVGSHRGHDSECPRYGTNWHKREI